MCGNDIDGMVQRIAEKTTTDVTEGGYPDPWHPWVCASLLVGRRSLRFGGNHDLVGAVRPDFVGVFKRDNAQVELALVFGDGAVAAADHEGRPTGADAPQQLAR